MKFSILALFIIIGPYVSMGQPRPTEDTQELYAKTLILTEQALAYLESAQKKADDSTFHFKGEWGSMMHVNFWFPLMGKKDSAYDSNCFSVASIHNILAKVYLQYPEHHNLLPMLDLAFDRIMTYQNKGSFNFWNLLTPINPHTWFEKETNELVRRPNNFPLSLKFMQKAANVADDADDTAAGLLAIYLRNKIYGQQIPDSLNAIHKIFDSYTDSNRNNRLWYNLWQGQGPESGAYLTWLGEEHHYSKKWNLIQELFHLGTFYLPISKMYPHAYEPYIPYGSNDLDPVVNANILRTLSIYGNQKGLAMEKAKNFIKKEVADKNYDFTASYYPNRYHLAYYVSKAHKNGVSELSESMDSMEEYILNKQNKRGAWSSREIINDGDSLQSTILAVNTLLNISGITKEESRQAIESGLDYILSKSIKEEEKVHWKGGVFFSGGTLVRHTVHWKSDAVTTALVIEALVNLRGQLEDQYRLLKANKLSRSNTIKKELSRRNAIK